MKMLRVGLVGMLRAGVRVAPELVRGLTEVGAVL